MEVFIVLLSLGLLIVGAVLLFQHYREQEAREAAPPPKPRIEMVAIKEEIKSTRWGLTYRNYAGRSCRKSRRSCGKECTSLSRLRDTG
jgi:hypothetical protein